MKIKIKTIENKQIELSVKNDIIIKDLIKQISK